MWTKNSRPSDDVRRSLLRRTVAATPFGRVRSIDAELGQLALLRWATGLVCLARTAPIVWASVYYFQPGPGGTLPALTVTGLTTMALIVAATVGIATPLTLTLLLVFYPRFDALMQTATLGTNLLCLLLGLFALSGAGASRSVDAWLMRRGGVAGAAIERLYGFVGIPTIQQLQDIYFVYFTAFALMNLGAVAHHWNDDAWQSGDLLRILATSSYLSRFWEASRAFEAYSWRAADAISSLGAFGQAAYQGLMLPLIFTKWGARAVVAWGALFFAVSLLALELSYLPPLEIIFWVALFRRPSDNDAPASRRIIANARSRWAHAAVLTFALAALATFVLHDFPVGDRAFRNERIDYALYTLGLDVPNVFNRDDLRTGDAWPVIYRGERETLLPYHGLSGERLEWVLWNDLFYLPTSLKWRREYRGPQSLGRDRDTFWRVVYVARFDHVRRDADESHYVIDYYETQASNVRLDLRRRFERRLVGTSRIVCKGRGAGAVCE